MEDRLWIGRRGSSALPPEIAAPGKCSSQGADVLCFVILLYMQPVQTNASKEEHLDLKMDVLASWSPDYGGADAKAMRLAEPTRQSVLDHLARTLRVFHLEPATLTGSGLHAQGESVSSLAESSSVYDDGFEEPRRQL